jgi:hypothetical protein
MAVPTFLAGSLNTDFRYKSTANVTDVNTIISDLSGELVALGWTDASGVGTGPWTSPAVAGATIKITASRISATRIAWVVNDQRGMLVNNDTDTRQDIDSSPGNEVRYFTNKFGCFVDSIRTVPECWGCGMLDNSPEAMGVPRVQHWATKGPRNNGGTLAGNTVENVYYWDTQGSATSYSAANPAVNRRNPVLTTTVHTTLSGALLFVPYEHQYGSAAAGFLLGRVFQALMTDSAAGAFGSEFTVPIDTGVTGVFKVIGLATSQNWRVCARKS